MLLFYPDVEGRGNGRQNPGTVGRKARGIHRFRQGKLAMRARVWGLCVIVKLYF